MKGLSKLVLSLLSLVLSGLSFQTSAEALGDWGSGGGYVWGDTQNPWFLKNTSLIRYCVLVDQEKFKIPNYKIQQLVSDALNFWSNEINRYTYFEKQFSLPLSGAQFLQIERILNREKCNGTEDLTFQFGLLSEEQKMHLKESSIPTENSLGLAVRTDYDPITMKGRGFIYIAPESPELKKRFPFLMDNFWEKVPNLLYLAIIHEMGHVLGIGHMNEENNLMSEDFAEKLILQQGNVSLGTAIALRSVYSFSLEQIKERELVKQLFSSGDEIKGFSVQVDSLSPNKVSFKIYLKTYNQPLLLGTFTSNNKIQFQFKVLNKMHIPMEQTVNPSWDDFKGKKIVLFNQLDLVASGNLTLEKTNETIPAMISMNKDGLKLSIFYKNQFFPDIF